MDSSLPVLVSNDLNLIQMLGLLAGGLALFLFGLELMTGGLKAVAGSRLQAALGNNEPGFTWSTEGSGEDRFGAVAGREHVSIC
jgi:hypothetical protein